MTYNDYRTHLNVCEFLGKEPAGNYKKVHDFLTVLWDGVELIVNSQHNRIVIQKEDGWLFEQDNKNGRLWCHIDRVWSFFEKDMTMELIDIEDFIRSAVEEHLKCTVVTPVICSAYLLGEVEEHLKCTVVTPLRDIWPTSGPVEEHLKCTVGTPEKQSCTT